MAEASHDYLGELDDLEGGYGFFEAGTVLHLPCFVLQGVVLMPSGTLPLNAQEAHMVETMKRIADAPPPATRMLAVVQWEPQQLPAVGCTAEVRKMAQEVDGLVKAVARGRQRVKVELLVALRGLPLLAAMVVPAEVTVLEEDPVLRVPRAVLQNEAWAPPWLEKLHDPYRLADRARAEACLTMPEAATAPSGPAQLSFWLAERLPVSTTVRQQLLEAPTAAERLRRVRGALGGYCVALCRRCKQQIASAQDTMLGSSATGGGLFVNPHGYVHDMVTLTRVQEGSVYLMGEPSTEFSWFPGYAWTIVHCSTCFSHLGWRFTAAEPALALRQFWGIRRGALATSDPSATHHSSNSSSATHLLEADHETLRIAWGLLPVPEDDIGGSQAESEHESEYDTASEVRSEPELSFDTEHGSHGPGSDDGVREDGHRGGQPRLSR